MSGTDPLLIESIIVSINFARLGPLSLFPFIFFGCASLKMVSFNLRNSILKLDLRLSKGMSFSFFISSSFSTGRTKVIQSLSTKYLIIFSLMILLSELRPDNYFILIYMNTFDLKHVSIYSLLVSSSWVSGWTISKLKSLIIQINLGASSFIVASLSTFD